MRLVDRLCANCHYWQDYSERVWALIEGKTKNSHRGDELRVCRYRPAPGADNVKRFYTSGDWSCSEFRRLSGI